MMKKYEYKILYRCNGHLHEAVRRYDDVQPALEALDIIYSDYEDAHIVRREVGEWEEIPCSSGGEGQCNS